MTRSILILPTFNEAENLTKFIEIVRQVVPDISVLIIDDNSQDGTGRIADQLAMQFHSLRVTHRVHERGLGSAYRTGFRLVHGEPFDVILTMDADFSHDPREIPFLISLIEQGADLVLGSRYCTGGMIVDWPAYRRALSRWGNWFTRLMLSVPSKDCTTGYRAYSMSALDKIETENVPGDGYVFLSQILLRATVANLKIVEHPITFKDRECGQSKMNWKVIGESMVLVTLIGLKRWVVTIFHR
jgi:dolichol-phosphate mannosyltransferase